VVADRRGEPLNPAPLNTIAWHFMQTKKRTDSKFFGEHLTYELNIYLHEGLRPNYQIDLKLI
jgi:hypothetical protein